MKKKLKKIINPLNEHCFYILEQGQGLPRVLTDEAFSTSSRRNVMAKGSKEQIKQNKNIQNQLSTLKKDGKELKETQAQINKQMKALLVFQTAILFAVLASLLF